MALPGIDTNVFHPLVDAVAVKRAGKAFCYIRASQGQTTDRAWASSVVGARLAGLPWGAYHALLQTDPAGQAAYFHYLTQGMGLTPWIDFEVAGVTLQHLAVWLQAYEQLSGRLAIIYTRKNIWDTARRTNPMLADQLSARHALSLAAYGTTNPALPLGWSRWLFHQYSQTGNVPGVPPPVDLNWFNGNLEALTLMANEINVYQILTEVGTEADARVRAALSPLADLVTITALRKFVFDPDEPPVIPPPPTPKPLFMGRLIVGAILRNQQGARSVDPALGSDIMPAGREIEVWGNRVVPLLPGSTLSERYDYKQDRVLNIWVDAVVRIAGTGGGAGLSLLWPSANRRINQRFGDNPQNYSQFELDGHEGLDIDAMTGDSVWACVGGVVTEVVAASTGHPYGNHIRIRHSVEDRQYKIVYAHLSAISVQVGQTVSREQEIGKAGNTGNSTGPHLHLGVYEQTSQGIRVNNDNGYNGYFNPLPFLYFPD